MTEIVWQPLGRGCEVAQAGAQRLFVGKMVTYALADEETELRGPVVVYWCILDWDGLQWQVVRFGMPYPHGYEHCKFEAEEFWRVHYPQEVQS